MAEASGQRGGDPLEQGGRAAVSGKAGDLVANVLPGRWNRIEVAVPARTVAWYAKVPIAFRFLWRATTSKLSRKRERSVSPPIRSRKRSSISSRSRTGRTT